VPLSAKECRDNAARCETMALSLIGPANAELRETMREVAAQWRRFAADAEARDGNPQAEQQPALMKPENSRRLWQGAACRPGSLAPRTPSLLRQSPAVAHIASAAEATARAPAPA